MGYCRDVWFPMLASSRGHFLGGRGSLWGCGQRHRGKGDLRLRENTETVTSLPPPWAVREAAGSHVRAETSPFVEIKDKQTGKAPVSLPGPV